MKKKTPIRKAIADKTKNVALLMELLEIIPKTASDDE
jgi:hypothetical protein